MLGGGCSVGRRSEEDQCGGVVLGPTSGIQGSCKGFRAGVERGDGRETDVVLAVGRKGEGRWAAQATKGFLPGVAVGRCQVV